MQQAKAAILLALCLAGSFLAASTALLWPVRPGVELLVPALGFASLATLAVLSAWRWQQPLLAALLVAFSAQTVAGTVAMDVGYAVLFHGRHYALADPLLLSADRAFGFDWRAMLTWFDHHPALSSLLAIAYRHCDSQIPLAIAALALRAEHQRLLIVISATWLSLLCVHVAGFFLPALGAYSALGLTAADHHHIALVSEGFTAVPTLAMRAADVLALPPGPHLGLMTFPSFHMAAAVLGGWAFWRVPVLRWAALAFNGAVAASALLHGSHYLVDLFAGGALAALGIASASRVVARIAPRLATRPAMREPLGEPLSGPLVGPLGETEPPIPRGAHAARAAPACAVEALVA